MRLVLISDTHGNKPVNIPDGDVLIHAGDLTPLGRHHETQKALKWLGSQPHKKKFLVPGNHDFLFQTEPGLAKQMCLENGITLLVDNEYLYEGVVFYGSPWTPHFGKWAFMLTEAELVHKFNRIPEDVDVLITHGPPWGKRDWNQQGEHCGSLALNDRVVEVQPKYHVFGHLHPAHGTEFDGIYTTFINAAQTDDYNQLRNYLKPFVVEI